MIPQTEEKIILIVRQTRLDELIARYNTADQARFYIEHLGADFSDYLAEDERYKEQVREVKKLLASLGRLQVVDRSFVPNFLFGKQDTVIVLGQDGLVANVLKYLDDQLVIGVNPDPQRWEGVLLPFNVSQLGNALTRVFSDRHQIQLVSMAKATLNNGQVLFGVNDIFIGPQSHTSARYTLQFGQQTEDHSSSGIIVSTGLGSTGWLRSILAGAAGIAGSITTQAPREIPELTFRWDANYLYFSVREPWPSKTSSAGITFGKITPDQPLTLVSQMPESGVVFSDGMESDFLEFNSGMQVEISLAEKKGHLVIG